MLKVLLFVSLASNSYAQERTQLLTVMKALLRVMESNKPAPSDINNLLILTRDLQNNVSNEFAGFANLEIIKNIGIPKIGDVIKTLRGEPHIMTTFGAFPLSIITFMTDADRQQYSPVVKTLINLLEKEFLDPSEMNTLLEQSGNLAILIPENLIFQIYNGFNGLN